MAERFRFNGLFGERGYSAMPRCISLILMLILITYVPIYCAMAAKRK